MAIAMHVKAMMGANTPHNPAILTNIGGFELIPFPTSNLQFHNDQLFIKTMHCVCFWEDKKAIK
jgi:hypothetical protein